MYCSFLHEKLAKTLKLQFLLTEKRLKVDVCVSKEVKKDLRENSLTNFCVALYSPTVLRLLALFFCTSIAGFVPQLKTPSAQRTPTGLTRIAEITRLSSDQAGQEIPVYLKATVGLWAPKLHFFSVQQQESDGRHFGIYVADTTAGKIRYQPGDLVEIEGVTSRGQYSPIVRTSRVRKLASGSRPRVAPIGKSEFRSGDLENTWISFAATIVSFKRDPDEKRTDLWTLIFDVDGEKCFGLVSSTESFDWKPWIQAQVLVKGIHGSRNNGRGQRIAGGVYLENLEAVKLVRSPPPVSGLRVLPIGSLFTHLSRTQTGEQVRLHGQITARMPSGDYYLQQDRAGLKIENAYPMEFPIGADVEVVGRLGRDDLGSPLVEMGRTSLLNATASPIRPRVLRAAELRTPLFAGSLVQADGEVESIQQVGDLQTLTLRHPEEGHVFRALLPELAELRVGDAIQVVGIGETASPDAWSHSIYIWPRNRDDIRILRRSPWWNHFPWGSAAAFCGISLAAILYWVAELRRRVRQQTADIRQHAGTLQQKTKELAEAKRLADEANIAKSRFLANISHELRTPLNGIMGFHELLLESRLDQTHRSWLEAAKWSADSLLGLLNDLLDFSKAEAGKMKVEQVAFSPLDTLQRLAEPMRYRARQKQLAFEIEIGSGFPEAVMGDPMRFRQMVVNLLSNAIKFTESGTISLNARTASEGQILIEVIDTGIGIQPEAIDRLFHPFEQADTWTSRKFGGTGLGLAICRELADLMGGAVGVESVLGQGSRFWIRLPLPEVSSSLLVQEKTDSSWESITQVLRDKRILLVEDHPVNQKLAAHILAGFGTRCELASNGLEALEKAEHAAFDLILMDCHMPLMDGFEATEKLRRQVGHNSRVPIIALTASVTSDSLDQAYASGMNACVSKPIDRRQLAKTMQEWLMAKDIRQLAEALAENENGKTLSGTEIERTVKLRVND
jgi:signal transduction histidine kinase/DNA-binding NarL/FixJ family response regulator